MEILSAVHFVSAFFYLFLIVFILIKNYYSLVNRVCALLIFCLFIWSIGESFIHTPFPDEDTAAMFKNIVSLGWISFSSCFLWFMFILIKKNKLLKTKNICWITSSLFLMFIYKQYLNSLLIYEKQTYGWWNIFWTESIWALLFLFYDFFYILISLYIISNAGGKEKNSPGKIHRVFLFICSVLIFICGFFLSIMFLKTNIRILPEAANILVFIWIIGIAYTILKYKLLIISPATAAENIIATMNDALFLLNQGGKIITVNQVALDLLGYKKKELEGKPFNGILSKKDSPAVYLDNVINKGSLKNYEVTFRAKNGDDIPVSLSNSILKEDDTREDSIAGVICIARDVSEYKKTEERLQRARNELESWLNEQTADLKKVNGELQEEIVRRKKVEETLASEKERLAVTLRSIGDGVITADIEGKIILINKVAEQLTGWQQEQAVGKPLQEVFNIIDSNNQQPYGNLVAEVVSQNDIITIPLHTLLISRDGEKRIVADSVAPIRDKASRIIGIILVFRDITNRQKIEEELIKTQKLESIGTLAGGIAHDFNNILTGILSNISLAKEVYAKPGDKIFEILTEAENASVRAKNLTGQLLIFSKGGSPVKKVASVAELIEDTVKFVLAGSKVKYQLFLSSRLWPVEIDVDQISQVIENLVINALQAMPEGGNVYINGENAFVSGRGFDTTILQGRYVKITVRDEGIGIPEKYLPKIFDPYFTTKQKGSGLGLAVSYSIIKKHYGYINAKSELGKGTTFCIYLPASEKQLHSAGKPIQKMMIKGEGKILVMDDEEIVRSTTQRILVSFGYEVELAEDGQQALDKYIEAKSAGVPFDVVILDLTIPGGAGGKEVIKNLRAIDPQLKAIASSGYSTDPVMAEFKKYGFDAVICKPYALEELNSTLLKMFENK